MRELYGGYDPGGNQDPAAFIVVERKDDLLRVCFQKIYLSRDSSGKKIDDPNLYSRFTTEISEIHNKIKLKKIGVDQTGLGKPIIEHLKDLKLPAEGMTLTTRSKEEILSNLKILLEQKKLVLPANDLNLLSNLNCIQSEVSRTGGRTFSHPKGTHDDLAYALALACWVASGRPANVQILKRDVPERKSKWREGLV